MRLCNTYFRINCLVGVPIFICAFPSLYTLLIGKEGQNDKRQYAECIDCSPMNFRTKVFPCNLFHVIPN